MRTSIAILILSILISCAKESKEGPESLELLSMKLNGTHLVSGLQNISANANLELVFSSAISPQAFESAFELSSNQNNPERSFTYSNQSSKVNIQTTLQPNTTYKLNIPTTAIGTSGERLSSAVAISFSTVPDETSYNSPACTGADCIQTVSLQGNNAQSNFQFYSSFPVYKQDIVWDNLEAVVVAVHGQSRNPDDYFNYLMGALTANQLEDKVLGIAPFFKQQSEAAQNDFYWSGITWRAGQDSASDASISSFGALDRILEHLANPEKFPNLKKVIIIGHSSGALFTQLYAAANTIESTYPNLEMTYVSGESQYFYYPDGQRINPSTQELYTPTSCSGYDFWPMGYTITPPFLSNVSPTEFNKRFLGRSIVYMLGSGSGSDSSLNTDDCNAVLLGPNRYQRGEYMFTYLEKAFSGQHAHRKVVISGLSHSGIGMYGAQIFRDWLIQELEK